MSLWFGCSHKKTTFPITLPDRARKVRVLENEAAFRTYIACLDCGKEIPYSWEMMKPLPSLGSALRAVPSGQMETAA